MGPKCNSPRFIVFFFNVLFGVFQQFTLPYSLRNDGMKFHHSSLKASESFSQHSHDTIICHLWQQIENNVTKCHQSVLSLPLLFKVWLCCGVFTIMNSLVQFHSLISLFHYIWPGKLGFAGVSSHHHIMYKTWFEDYSNIQLYICWILKNQSGLDLPTHKEQFISW